MKQVRWLYTILILVSLLLSVSCTNDDEEREVLSPTERYTGDSYGELYSPWVQNEQSRNHVTRWSCLYFGSYPTNEVVSGPFEAVDSYALSEGDVITDAALFTQLEQAEWDAADDTEVNGHRYHRLKGSGAVTASVGREQHYKWADTDVYHYFAYAPIKWRVLKIEGTKALLLADRMPDTFPFNTIDTATDWSRCSLRQWLNVEFLSNAFSSAEREAILETEVKNTPNEYYGTESGPDTYDRVFILSGKEVFALPLAADYGFYPFNGLDDPARRFRSTLYAKCRGAWWSPVKDYQGNSFWLMRTSGYTNATVTYICDFGYIYNRGTSVTCDDAAVLPAITVDLTKASWTVAAPVVSTDIVQ